MKLQAHEQNHFAREAPKEQFERFDGKLYKWGSRELHDAIEAAIERNKRTFGRSELGERYDANQTAFLARDLVYVQRDVMKVLHERLRAAEFVTIKSEVPRGAESWVYRMMDIAGEARIGAHLAADDAPNVEALYEEFPQPLTHLSASYQYTIEDLDKAALSGLPLQRDKANAAAEVIARGLDRLMRVGDARQGITGLLNNPNVPVLTLANGEWDLVGTTADQIIADWAEIEAEVIDQSGDVHEATRFLVPTWVEGQLVTRAKAAESDLTLLRYLLANSRMIRELRRWSVLDSITTADATIADPPLGLVYDPNPENVYAEVPVPFASLPPQARNFGWVVPCFAIFGGVVFKRPLSALYVENFD